MRQTPTFLIAILFVIGSPFAWAKCPSWMDDQSIPICPRSNNTILPDTYPALAHIVSDKPQQTTDGLFAEDEFTPDFVEGVLKGAGDRVPLIFLPVTDETMERVKVRIRKAAKSEQQRLRWEKALIQVPKAERYTWEQDYFQSTIDPKTGTLALRWIRDYNFAGYSLDAIAEKGQAVCSKINQGPSLPPEDEQNYAYDTAKSGGNIEALPGGLCLHGDNQPWDGFAEHYCGNRRNEVVISTDWLAIGHVDEIISVVKKPNIQAPCDFALVAASPSKAIELMKGDPDALFGAYYTRNTSIDRQKLAESRAQSEAIQSVCTKVAEHRSSMKKPAIDCTKLMNRDVVEAFSNTDIGILNRLIQGKMDETKKTIRAKLKQRLPQCSVEIVDVPDLFYTFSFLVEKKGADPKSPIEQRYELPEGAIVSVVPNPTNHVISGTTVIYPHPQNDAFASYLEKTYKRLGVTPNPIDSFEYGHVGAGNVHCASNAIRFCRPAE